MNEEDIIKGVKSATEINVSSRIDEAILEAARKKAAEMKSRVRRRNAGQSRARRVLQASAIAAAILVACGVTLVASPQARKQVAESVTEFLDWLGGSGISDGAEDSAGAGYEGPGGSPAAGPTCLSDARYGGMHHKYYGVNPFIHTDVEHVSTFALDVDTGSYTICRRYIDEGNIPPEEAVRVEEFLNYFDYRYAPPAKDGPEVYIEGAPSKFALFKGYHLLRIGIKAREIPPAKRKDANLTLAVDVSQSMGLGDRIGLVRQSLRMLLDELRPTDRVAIVAFSSEAQSVLEPTYVKDKEAVVGAVESLAPQEDTNAEAGLTLAYRIAARMFDEKKINRVILCSDGLANVGKTGAASILGEIRRNARKGIYLSAIGFGMGNYNDVLMEQLADNGDGRYAYIDTPEEAKRVFVKNLTGTLQVVAKNVKVQVDFNPDIVYSYRLIGYENRRINDGVGRDGGEMGSGQSMTALYEIKFRKNAKADRFASLSIRYSDPDSEKWGRIEKEISRDDFGESFEKASTSFRLAAGVAEFAEIMRKSYWAQKSRLADVLPVIRRVLEEREDDADVIELLHLIAKANKMKSTRDRPGP